MSEDGIVEVYFLSHMDDAQVAGVIAEDAGNGDDDQRHDIACLEGVHGQDEDEPSDHSVDHPQNSHGG